MGVHDLEISVIYFLDGRGWWILDGRYPDEPRPGAHPGNMSIIIIIVMPSA